MKSEIMQLRTALINYNGVMGGVGGVNITAVLKPGDDIDDYNDTKQEYSCFHEYKFFFEK